MMLLSMMLGSAVAIAITVFILNCFNVYSNPFFEPFFSPWPWFIIYIITNSIQLLAMTIVTFGVKKIFKFNSAIPQYKYVIVGFFFSMFYIVGLTFLISKAEKLNNYPFIFAIFPITIFITLMFVVRFINLNDQKGRAQK